jgi:hypothetical protein
MNNLLAPLRALLKIPELRKRLIFTAIVIAVFRLVAHVPAPGINLAALKQMFDSSAFLSLLDVFSGGTLGNFSIMARSTSKRRGLRSSKNQSIYASSHYSSLFPPRHRSHLPSPKTRTDHHGRSSPARLHRLHSCRRHLFSYLAR